MTGLLEKVIVWPRWVGTGVAVDVGEGDGTGEFVGVGVGIGVGVATTAVGISIVVGAAGEVATGVALSLPEAWQPPAESKNTKSANAQRKEGTLLVKLMPSSLLS